MEVSFRNNILAMEKSLSSSSTPMTIKGFFGRPCQLVAPHNYLHLFERESTINELSWYKRSQENLFSKAVHNNIQLFNQCTILPPFVLVLMRRHPLEARLKGIIRNVVLQASKDVSLRLFFPKRPSRWVAMINNTFVIAMDNNRLVIQCSVLWSSPEN